jgi:exonuclease VII small subunit
MEIENRKYAIIEKIISMSETEMSQLEESIESILSSSTTLDEYNKDLERGELEIKKGDYLLHEEAKKLLNTWRSK